MPSEVRYEYMFDFNTLGGETKPTCSEKVDVGYEETPSMTKTASSSSQATSAYVKTTARHIERAHLSLEKLSIQDDIVTYTTKEG